MKKLKIIVIAVVALVAGYEIAFRCCTSRWGEINTETTPVSLYYTCDLTVGAKAFQTIFSPRASLAFGKVRLAEGTGAYVSGGKFFRRKEDGSWENVSTAFQERKRK